MHTFIVNTTLIRPVNDGEETFTVAEATLTLTLDLDPMDPATPEKLGDMAAHTFCEVSESEDRVRTTVIVVPFRVEV